MWKEGHDGRTDGGMTESGRKQEDPASTGRRASDLCFPIGRAVQLPRHVDCCGWCMFLDSQRSP